MAYLGSKKSCLTLANPWTVACQAPLSLGSPRQECWSGCHSGLQENSQRRDRTVSPVLAGGFSYC